MSVFVDIPLGTPIPASPHAVSVSLPTMRSVRGYEEKDPEITRKLQLGYPRFVVNPFNASLAQEFAPAHPGRKIWLVSSGPMAAHLAEYLNQGAPGSAASFENHGVHGVAHADTAELFGKAKQYLQHIGGFLSSREAEDHLVRRGKRSRAEPEPLFAGNADAEVRRHLRPVLPGAKDEDIFLASNGMNAVYAAFRAVGDAQAARGRNEWIQLGWLYLDSIAILKKFNGAGAYHHLKDPFDLDGLEALLRDRGSRIAGLVTEMPTNPLIQTPNAERLADLCRRHGIALILDPSVSSAFNANLLPFADIVVCSLTKYTGSAGDVLSGFAAVNRTRPDAALYREGLRQWLEPVYARDVARLASQIGDTRKVLSQINASTPEVEGFLRGHPAVAEVYWALKRPSQDNYRHLQHPGGGPGGMISFVVKGDLATFYDPLRLPKGPSFGMSTTLICPFMYLAHYDLITSAAGRAELAASHLSPDLLRLCVGTEPVDEIIGALDEALARLL
ncbi:MAG TPA: PLP-dependent transferase [Opitutaceae bacterium]|jgi:cystathionine gamma-synthase